MTNTFALIGASCEALDHPTECTEPAPGTVEKTASHSVTVNGTQIATIDTADMNFPSHAHDYTSSEGCHQDESHSLDPNTGSTSVTVNGSPLYVVDDAVTTDPTSGGDVNIVNAGNNTSVEESP